MSAALGVNTFFLQGKIAESRALPKGTTKCFPPQRRASTIQIVRPSESTAETQPQFEFCAFGVKQNAAMCHRAATPASRRSNEFFHYQRTIVDSKIETCIRAGNNHI